jgi:hypothetical protein
MAILALRLIELIYIYIHTEVPALDTSLEKLRFKIAEVQKQHKLVGRCHAYRKLALTTGIGARLREEYARHCLCRAHFAQAHGKGRPAHFYPVKNFAVRFGKRQRTALFFAVRNTCCTSKKRCLRPSAGRRRHTLSVVRR